MTYNGWYAIKPNQTKLYIYIFGIYIYINKENFALNNPKRVDMVLEPNQTQSTRNCTLIFHVNLSIIQILHYWINVSLQESCENNKGLYEVAVSWSGFPTMRQKTKKDLWYCKIPLERSGLIIIMCPTPESLSDEYIGWGAQLLFSLLQHVYLLLIKSSFLWFSRKLILI